MDDWERNVRPLLRNPDVRDFLGLVATEGSVAYAQATNALALSKDDFAHLISLLERHALVQFRAAPERSGNKRVHVELTALGVRARDLSRDDPLPA